VPERRGGLFAVTDYGLRTYCGPDDWDNCGLVTGCRIGSWRGEHICDTPIRWLSSCLADSSPERDTTIGGFPYCSERARGVG